MEIFIGGSSSSSSRPIHVYLSFKGDDETCRFTDRLWAALESNDLNTFWDDKKLHPGDSILLPRHFLKAIRQSNISIVVFSKSYDASTWCLEELSEIAARIHEPRYTVFPIFYDPDSSEVQSQSNSFGKAFAEHEQRFTGRNVRSWRSALNQVASLSGWHVPSEPEPLVIDEIIKEVKRKMRELVYADVDIVGMKSQVREVEELLDLGSNDEVRVVGICGMGGLGKTTLARVLHNRISHHFDASYFVLNALEFFETTGLRHHVRTLIVLDCVDIGDIVPSLAIEVRRNQLGGGSRIIITTRDEGVLKAFEKHHIYRVKLLSKDEALLLFCRKAFKYDFPVRGYDEEPINRALEYANGHPLAIVTLGSFLYNRRASDWSNALAQFKILDNPLLMKVLRESFDDLDQDLAEAFLDIACFFTGKEIKFFVNGILRSCGLTEDEQIQLLVEKSLVTIIDQRIQMHCLLQEMGREIVRQEFPSEPKGWSRLWDFNDIYNVMQNDTATVKVEAMVLELEDSSKEYRTLRVESLSRMENLRLLIFCNVKFCGVLNRLPCKLRYISWHQYPFTSLPSGFKPYNLKELILPDSRITSIWDEEEALSLSDIAYDQRFTFLRNMDLSGSKDLFKIPNFMLFEALRRLNLEGCTKLSHLHSSITSLSCLSFLNLRNCTNLVSIPNGLFSLRSLEVLNLAGCSNFAYCLNFTPSEELGEGETIQ